MAKASKKTKAHTVVEDANIRSAAEAVAVMGAVLVLGAAWLPAWDSGGMPERLARLMLLVVAGAGSYFATLAVLGFRLRHFARRAVR